MVRVLRSKCESKKIMNPFLGVEWEHFVGSKMTCLCSVGVYVHVFINLSFIEILQTTFFAPTIKSHFTGSKHNTKRRIMAACFCLVSKDEYFTVWFQLYHLTAPLRQHH